MKARLVWRTREAFGRGLVEIVIWQLPRPTPPSRHPFKYRLVFVVDGVRVVGYDNERGKGDHRHLRGRESPYRFVDVPRLFDDFWQDVQEANHGEA